MSEQQQNEFASTASLVELVSAITTAAVTFPDDKRIKKLNDVATGLLDQQVIQAIVLQNSALQQQLNNRRQSPLASQLR